jgi:hypothetical protein
MIFLLNGIYYPPEQLAEDWLISRDICKRVAPLTKERGNIFAIHLRKKNTRSN